MARGRTRADLDADRMLELALTRLVEILGETASRTSEEFRRGHAGIPWREIVAMRNRLIHGYDQVDRDILWQVVTSDLPPLVLSPFGRSRADERDSAPLWPRRGVVVSPGKVLRTLAAGC